NGILSIRIGKMIEALWYGAAMTAGMLLGMLYFGGLWMTVRALPRSKHPGVLILGSYFLRLALTGICFALIAHGGLWDRLLLCLLGFFLTRLFIVRFAAYPGSVYSAGKEGAWKRD
ncbi:MAG: N-ATPase subunit AtpR, partial [Candidatus Latescibacterota bacterium]